MAIARPFVALMHECIHMPPVGSQNESSRSQKTYASVFITEQPRAQLLARRVRARGDCTLYHKASHKHGDVIRLPAWKVIARLFGADGEGCGARAVRASQCQIAELLG